MSVQETLVPSGAAYFPVADPGATRKYAFLAVPGVGLFLMVDRRPVAVPALKKPLKRRLILGFTPCPVLHV